MEFPPQQQSAMSAVEAWRRDKHAKQVFRMFGFAGTGKTTLARHLCDPGRWRFAAFTGKASHVLRQKGCDNASTIHSLIYRPAGMSLEEEMRLLNTRIKQLEAKPKPTAAEIEELRRRLLQRTELRENRRPRFALWEESPLTFADCDGIVVDEVSMVDERLGRDLESFGKKILVLGDPAQLPPVGGGGYFTAQEPDVLLTEIHRQARESGILRLATEIREGRILSTWVASEYAEADVSVRRRASVDSQELGMMRMAANQVLCGRNATRRQINVAMRAERKRDNGGPVAGDRLVCLRNDRESGLYNGSQWIVDSALVDRGAKTVDLTVHSEDDRRTVITTTSWLHHMIGEEDALREEPDRRENMEFDYSYGLTVHKAQGSQWSEVLLMDESAAFGQDARKWLYTGVTRAAERLTVVL